MTELHAGPALLFDTETTGIDDEAEIIEAAWLRPKSELMSNDILLDEMDTFLSQYKPDCEISFGAMATHHILPTDIDGCPPSHMFSLPEGIEYLVGHQIDFDWKMAGGDPKYNRICTLAMSKHIWPDATRHTLTALTYMLYGATDETRARVKGAHNAMQDVLLLEDLLVKILEETEITTWQRLHEYSEECRIPLTIDFGKHSGATLEWLVENDRGYVGWLLQQDWLDPYLRAGIDRQRGL